MAKRKTKARVEPLQSQESAGTGPKSWLEAIYHFHVFHYRMPQTAAIAALNPLVPSPLTVKFAMVASLLQMGRDSDAKSFVTQLPAIEVLIVPPKSALAFKAFLRYRSVPAVESTKTLDESGSYYPSRPHTREYSIPEGELVVYVGVSEDMKATAQESLRRVRYLGCKDSLVWCREVRQIDMPAEVKAVKPISAEEAGLVILLADFNSEASFGLNDIIPGQRDEAHYKMTPCILPGTLSAVGRSKIFRRNDG